MFCIGSFFKIRLFVDLTVVVILLMMLVINGLVSAAAWFSIYFFVLLHEFGHALTGRAVGVDVNAIYITPFGGVAEMSMFLISPKREIAIILAGPLVNFVLAAFFGTIYPFFSEEIAKEVVLFCAVVNISLGVFNLFLPIFPMDGGRILRAIVHAITKDYYFSTLAAVRTAQVLAVPLIGVFIYLHEFVAALISFLMIFMAQKELVMTYKRLEILQVLIKASERHKLPPLYTLPPEEADENVKFLMEDEEVYRKVKAIQER